MADIFIIGIEAAGVVGFFVMLTELVSYFADPDGAAGMVALAGAISLAAADGIITLLFEFTKLTSLQFITSVVMGALLGMHVCIIWLYTQEALVKGSAREIAVAMVDFQGGCVWIFGAIGGGVVGGLIASNFDGWVFAAGFVGGVIGLVFGVPFELVWLELCPRIVMRARGMPRTAEKINGTPSDTNSH